MEILTTHLVKDSEGVIIKLHWVKFNGWYLDDGNRGGIKSINQEEARTLIENSSPHLEHAKPCPPTAIPNIKP